MKVKVDGDYNDPFEDFEATIGVYLDDGTEVGRYCIVDNPEQERASLEKMIRSCVTEEFAKHPVICNQCAKPVEVQRYCYAVPVCFSCLHPPPSLQFVDEDDLAYARRIKADDARMGITRTPDNP
jgi:hypothetical protein